MTGVIDLSGQGGNPGPVQPQAPAGANGQDGHDGNWGAGSQTPAVTVYRVGKARMALQAVPEALAERFLCKPGPCLEALPSLSTVVLGEPVVPANKAVPVVTAVREEMDKAGLAAPMVVTLVTVVMAVTVVTAALAVRRGLSPLPTMSTYPMEPTPIRHGGGPGELGERWGMAVPVASAGRAAPRAV
jgi:hypothetical protein